jgi:hypothetical protein
LTDSQLQVDSALGTLNIFTFSNNLKGSGLEGGVDIVIAMRRTPPPVPLRGKAVCSVRMARVTSMAKYFGSHEVLLALAQLLNVYEGDDNRFSCIFTHREYH